MEIAEILTQIGFYAGWPKAWAAFRLAKDVWSEDTVLQDAKLISKEMIFPIGEPNTAYAKYFIGNSYLAPISTEQVKISTLPLNRVVVITGIFTRQRKAEDRCL